MKRLQVPTLVKNSVLLQKIEKKECDTMECLEYECDNVVIINVLALARGIPQLGKVAKSEKIKYPVLELHNFTPWSNEENLCQRHWSLSSILPTRLVLS